MVLLKLLTLLILLTACFSSEDAITRKPGSQLPSDGDDPAFLLLTPSSAANMNITGGSSPGNTLVLTLKNTGDQSTQSIITPSISGSTANFEITVNNCTGISLSADESCTISIRPIAVGNKSYSMNLSLSDASITSNTIVLSGTSTGFSTSIQGTENKINSASASAGAEFGISVAADATSIVAGAFADSNGNGSASLFRLDPSDNLWKETKLTASDGAANDLFGYSVAISSNTIVVGSPYDDASAVDSGSAYIYRLDPSDNTWHETKLTASDATSVDGFGASVAVHNTMVAVGAQLANDRGAIYVFRLDPSDNLWKQTKLTSSDIFTGDFFAQSIDMDNNHIIAGSAKNDDAGNGSGSAYIFRLDPSDNTWKQTKLTASDAAANDEFGLSVSISGSIAVVGSPYDDTGATNAGSVYIYQLDPSDNSWRETKLNASSPLTDANFGSHVSIYNNTIAVGADRDSEKANYAGSTYIFQLDPSDNSWKETKLIAGDGAANDNYGKVALANNLLVVGSPKNDSLGTDIGAIYTYNLIPLNNSFTLTATDGAASYGLGESIDMVGNTIVVGATIANSAKGAVYVFRLDPSDNLWKETKLTASDGAASDLFGWSVAASNQIIAVGAIGDDTGASNSGSVYVYRFDPSDNTWAQTKLNAYDPGANDYFGISLDIDNFSIIIGSYNDDNGTDSGAAYLYRFDPSDNTWVYGKLVASDAAGFDYFGQAVAIDGNTIAIGAPGDQANRGAVYHFRLDPSDNVWRETKITSSDTGGNKDFGMSVDIWGNTLIVGAPRSSLQNSFQGDAYIYQFDPSSNTWSETLLSPSDGATDDKFGQSVSISGNNILIGSPYDDDGGTDTGSAYLYRLDPSSNTWLETKITHSSPSADDNFGFAVHIDSNQYIISTPKDDDQATDSGTVLFNKFEFPN